MSYHVLSGLGQAAPEVPKSGALGPLMLLLVAVGVGGLFFWAASSVKPAPMLANRYRRNARWSRAYKNRLPDSAFLYVAPGGTKTREDSATVTIPRNLRKFPYKDPSGRVDLPHLRNALARIGRANIPESQKAALATKARKLLALATGKPYAQLAARAERARERRRELRVAA